MTTIVQPLDLQALKARQQAAWASGDYTVIGTTVVIVGEQLCEAVDLRAGQHVLDVATGHGVTALAAARRWCDVTGIDYVAALLERGRERAAADRLPVNFQEGDAEDLPFRDRSFDVVLSTFGVMFTPDQEKAARELLRVCRPGGKIGLANWTPDSLIGHVFRAIGRYLPPAPGVKSPALWGTEERLRELFGDQITTLQATPRYFNFRYRSVGHWLEVFRTYYGPMEKAFAALDEEGQAGLERDLTELARRFDRGEKQGLVLPSEYLEVVAIRR
jgi:ubiquinone/menaquinone biosynthesis C-methylase UbiE